MFYRRDVDDMFAQYSFCDHADKFKKYLLSKHSSINFAIEKEKDVCLPFLVVTTFCENEKFAINVHRKKTISGV